MFDGAKNIAIDSLELSGEAKDTKNPSLDKDDIADIMFTTGTTSDPKAVCLSHYNIASSARNINGFIGNSADEREVLGLPLSHSFWSWPSSLFTPQRCNPDISRELCQSKGLF